MKAASNSNAAAEYMLPWTQYILVSCVEMKSMERAKSFVASRSASNRYRPRQPQSSHGCGRNQRSNSLRIRNQLTATEEEEELGNFWTFPNQNEFFKKIILTCFQIPFSMLTRVDFTKKLYRLQKKCVGFAEFSNSISVVDALISRNKTKLSTLLF